MQSIIHEETAFALFRQYFESGDKTGKMLALRLKQLENRQSIPFICDSTGGAIYEQTEFINLSVIFIVNFIRRVSKR